MTIDLSKKQSFDKTFRSYVLIFTGESIVDSGVDDSLTDKRNHV